MHINKIKDRYNDQDGSLYGKKNIEDSVAMLYHENSKLNTHNIRSLGENINTFNNPYILERSSQPFKCYPGCPFIELPTDTHHFSNISLFDVIGKRRSIRNFDPNYTLSLNELSILLHQSYGVTHKTKVEGLSREGHLGLRNIPAAGGLYPLEIYLVLFNSHLPAGLYHYRPDKNALEMIKEGTFPEYLSTIIQTEPYTNLSQCAGLIITTGMIERIFIKYGDRGYRFLVQEVGALSLMISLLAESINLGSCMLGGYQDDKVNLFLDIDGVFETVNNMLVIGKPA